MMIAHKLTDAALIEAYELAATSRRRTSKLNLAYRSAQNGQFVSEKAGAKSNPNTISEPDQWTTIARSKATPKVTITVKAGRVTVSTKNAKPVSSFSSSSQTTALGYLKISIPEYKRYRK